MHDSAYKLIVSVVRVDLLCIQHGQHFHEGDTQNGGYFVLARSLDPFIGLVIGSKGTPYTARRASRGFLIKTPARHTSFANQLIASGLTSVLFSRTIDRAQTFGSPKAGLRSVYCL